MLAVLLAGLTLTGCGPRTVGGEAGLGEEFSLSIGQKAIIKGEKLELTFVRVTEDSRCPKGATCVWEGRATSVVSIVSNNTTEIELSEPGLTASPYQYIFRDYWITFHLLPYPEVGKEITSDQYRLQMSVSKLK